MYITERMFTMEKIINAIMRELGCSEDMAWYEYSHRMNVAASYGYTYEQFYATEWEDEDVLEEQDFKFMLKEMAYDAI